MAALLALVGHFELFVMVLCRTAGVFLAAPALSSEAVPMLVKVLTVGAISLCLLPVVMAEGAGAAATASWLGFGLMAAKELIVGLVLGFFALLAFTGVQVAGELVSEQMGFALSQEADPTTEAETSVVGQLATVLGLLLFLAVDGHHWLLAALARSFTRMPVGGVALTDATLERVVNGFVGMYESGVVLAAPVLCATLLTTVAVGVISRVVPQINALMLSFPLKVAVGLIIFGVALPFMAYAAEKQFAAMGRGLGPLIGGR